MLLFKFNLFLVCALFQPSPSPPPCQMCESNRSLKAAFANIIFRKHSTLQHRFLDSVRVMVDTSFCSFLCTVVHLIMQNKPYPYWTVPTNISLSLFCNMLHPDIQNILTGVCQQLLSVLVFAKWFILTFKINLILFEKCVSLQSFVFF